MGYGIAWYGPEQCIPYNLGNWECLELAACAGCIVSCNSVESSAGWAVRYRLAQPDI